MLNEVRGTRGESDTYGILVSIFNLPATWYLSFHCCKITEKSIINSFSEGYQYFRYNRANRR